MDATDATRLPQITAMRWATAYDVRVRVLRHKEQKIKKFHRLADQCPNVVGMEENTCIFL